MKNNRNNKFIKGLAIPLCLTMGTTTLLNATLDTRSNIIYAQTNYSDGFTIEKPYIENDSLKFRVEGTDKSSSFYERYWTKIDKVLIDDKDFGFNNKSTASRDYYHLYDGVLTANQAGALEYFKKHDKHKIEVIFSDGSKKSYEEEGYTKPADADEKTVEKKTKYEISKIEKQKNWKNEPYLVIELTNTSIYEEFKNDISKISINGTDLTSEQISKVEPSKWFGLRFFDEKITNLINKENNDVVITLKDSQVINYTVKDDSANTEKTPKETSNNPASLKDSVVITNVEKSAYGKELLFSLTPGLKANEVLSQTKEIVLNGKSFDVKNFKPHWSGKINSIGVDEGIDLFKLWKDKGKNTIVFKFKDDTQSKEFSQGEEEKKLTIADKLEDGDYTIGFNALYADGREGSSMLEGFFDKNVKLTVKDGKKTITMLNTLFAYSLYDFAVENNGTWTSSQKEFYGEKNSAGQHDKALFSFSIDNLEETHQAGVIVGHMGGLTSQIGNFDKYTKVKLKFKPEVTKGWSNFDLVEKEIEAKKNGEALLQKKLIANGVDTNKDGKVTAEELKDFKGKIDIGALVIDGAVDKGEIFDLDLLKNMGPGVTEFSSGSNSLGELPEDLFENAVNIETINLGGNKITNLPEKLFENNKKLKTLNLSANNLGTLPEKLFENNSNLETLRLDQTWLSSLPNNIFKNNTKLKSLSINENKLTSLTDDLFTNNSELEFLDLGKNELSSLPSSIGNLVKLKQLNAVDNKLTVLPTGVEKLEKLSELYLNYNNITNLDDNLWINLAKNSGKVYLVGNKLDSIPVEKIRNNGKLTLLDVANNNLPANLAFSEQDLKSLGINPQSTHGYYPQRSAVSLKAEAKNNKITIAPESDKLTILNLFHWFHGRSEYYGGEGIIQGTKKYDEFLNKMTQPMAEMLKGENYNRNWDIVTKVERIRGDEVVEISNTRVSNEDDKPLTASDPNMKDGDTYRITKVLYENRSTQQNIRIADLETIIKATVETKEENNSKTYTVPVKLRKASEDSLSMGNGALEQAATVVEDENGAHISLTFKPLYISGFNMTGHLTKLGTYPTLDDMKNKQNLTLAQVGSTYTENGTTFPKTVTFSVKKLEKQIGVKVWVDAMDEIAKQAGLEDGSQNAILEFDLENKKETNSRAEITPSMPNDTLDKENETEKVKRVADDIKNLIDKDTSISAEQKEKIKDFISNITPKEKLSAKVNNKDISVILDNRELNAKKLVVSEVIGDSAKKVEELVAKQLTNKEVVATYDINLKDNNGEVVDKHGKTRAVTVTIVKENDEELEVYYVNGEKLEKVPSIYKDGQLMFFTDHFSTYTIVKSKKQVSPNNDDDKSPLFEDNDENNENNGTGNGNKNIQSQENNGTQNTSTNGKFLPNTGLNTTSYGILTALALILTALGLRKIKK